MSEKSEVQDMIQPHVYCSLAIGKLSVQGSRFIKSCCSSNSPGSHSACKNGYMYSNIVSCVQQKLLAINTANR